MATSKNNPVGWFEIYVSDIQRACKFYETILDTTLTKLPQLPGMGDVQMWAFPMDMNATGATGALVQMPDIISPGNNSVLVYFHTEDCAVEEKRIRDYGNKVEMSKSGIGENGFIVLAFDTEGNRFGVHSIK